MCLLKFKFSTKKKNEWTFSAIYIDTDIHAYIHTDIHILITSSIICDTTKTEMTEMNFLKDEKHIKEMTITYLLSH